MNICKIESNRWYKSRTRDNATIKTMTDAQHRAISMLALYGSKLNDACNCYSSRNIHIKVSYSKFFVKALPTMLHAAGLPELDFEEDFRGTANIRSIVTKVNQYLRYIDRRFGTWYEIMEPDFAA